MDYRFEPYHLCYRATKAGQNVDVLNENLRFFKAQEEFYNDLFEKHHNVEEDFILVRFSEILLFNAALSNELGDFEKALGFMRYAVLINPLSIENWAFKARIEEQLGDTYAAVNSIEEIIKYEMNFTREINTQIIDWRYEQAKILRRAGKNLEAFRILNQYFGLDPRKPESIRELIKEIKKALATDVQSSMSE
jgi:tetratricopeptide (TPR) repeat protein